MRRYASILVAVAAALALALASSSLGAIAQDRPTEHHPLVGAWIVDLAASDVARPDELIVLLPGGVLVESSAAAVWAGSWSPTGERTADVTYVSPVSDAQRGFQGFLTIRGTLEVSESGQTLSGTYTIEVPDGLSEEIGIEAGELGPGAMLGQRVALERMGDPVAPIPDFGALAQEPDGSPAPRGNPPAATAAPVPAASPEPVASPPVTLPVPSPQATLPGEETPSDACAPLGQDWSVERLLGRGVDFDAVRVPDLGSEFLPAERGTLTFYHSTEPEGHEGFWDAWWLMWAQVRATMEAPSGQSRWLILEHEGRFFPFEARTSGFRVDPDLPRVPAPGGPCRLTLQDGEVVAWTGLNILSMPTGLEFEWARYSWFESGRLDCTQLAHPCGPGRGGTEWWCVEFDAFPRIAPGWSVCPTTPATR